MGDSKALDHMLQAPIPVLSNRLILQLMQLGKIRIDGYKADRLAPTAYQLCVYRIRFCLEDEEGLGPPYKTIILQSGVTRDLRPGEYAIVSPEESIQVAEGFVVDFFPSSWCIQKNLLVTAGRLDYGYHDDLVFGIYNAGKYDVRLDANVQFLRASFAWLGPDNIPIYKDKPPGAYIPELAKLRERQSSIETEVQALARQEEEVARSIAELQRLSESNP